MPTLNSKRDPFEGLGDALSALTESHNAAVQEVDPALQGARGPRSNRRYPSEERRLKLTLDVDLEPTVKDVLAAMAQTPPASYGSGPIRPGDLAVAALILGLLILNDGSPHVAAEWSFASRGSRRVDLSNDVMERWWAVARDFGVEV